MIAAANARLRPAHDQNTPTPPHRDPSFLFIMEMPTIRFRCESDISAESLGRHISIAEDAHHTYRLSQYGRAKLATGAQFGFGGIGEHRAPMRARRLRITLRTRITEMKTPAVLFLVVAVCLSSGARAAEVIAEAVGGWYVSPLLQWWRLDGDREASSRLAGQVGIGYEFADEWGVELAGGGGGFSAYCGCRLSLAKASLDAIRSFQVGSGLHPYLVAGIDGFHDRLDGYPSTTAIGADLGAGLKWDIGHEKKSTPWQLRVEAKYQREFSDHTASASGVGEIVYSVGMQYWFVHR